MINKSPNPKVIEWIDSVNENNLFMSTITVGEIHKGISKLNNSKKKTELLNWVNNFLIPRFKERTLIIDIETSTIWGEILGKNEKKGKKIPAIDALISAQSIQNKMTLVTRNIKDFKYTDCKLFNPWD